MDPPPASWSTGRRSRVPEAELLSWPPARTYTVDQVDPGPATAATAAFRHGKDLVRMTVTCEDGTPSHTVSRTQQKGAAPAVAPRPV